MQIVSRVQNQVVVEVEIEILCAILHPVLVFLHLFKMDKAEIDVTISKVLNYKTGVIWCWLEDVDSSDDAVNKAEFKMPLFWSLKLNIASQFVSRLPGKSLDNCHPNCLPVDRDRKESTHLSKEEA